MSINSWILQQRLDTNGNMLSLIWDVQTGFVELDWLLQYVIIASSRETVSVHFKAVKRKVTHYVFRTHIANALRTWSHPLVNGGHGASPRRGGDGWKPESLTGANCPVPLQPQCPEDAWRQCIHCLWILGFLCVWRHSPMYRIHIGRAAETQTQWTNQSKLTLYWRWWTIVWSKESHSRTQHFCCHTYTRYNQKMFMFECCLKKLMDWVSEQV